MDVNNLNNINSNNYSDFSSSLQTTTSTTTTSTTTTSTTTDSTEDYSSKQVTSTGLATSSYQENQNLKENIDALLEEVNGKLEEIDKEITYSLHEKLNRYIITVKDRNTGEVIRECPPKEQLDLFAQILESAGLLFDEFS